MASSGIIIWRPDHETFGFSLGSQLGFAKRLLSFMWGSEIFCDCAQVAIAGPGQEVHINYTCVLISLVHACTLWFVYCTICAFLIEVSTYSFWDSKSLQLLCQSLENYWSSNRTTILFFSQLFTWYQSYNPLES